MKLTVETREHAARSPLDDGLSAARLVDHVNSSGREAHLRVAKRAQEGFNVLAREFASLRLEHQILAGLFGCQCHSIWPDGGQGIEDVDDANDLREQRYLVSAQAIRITAAVQPFMM